MPKELPRSPTVKRRKIASSSWQESELRHFLKKNARDPVLNSKTVFLANPEEKKQIDRIIEAYLWPGVVKALVGTPIRVSESEEGFPASLIRDREKTYTTRSLTFVFEDPDRPLVSGGGPPWFCRGSIECSLLDYMTTFEFYAHFPMNFDLRRIIELLSDPLFVGYPPNLSVEPRRDGGHILVVSFAQGSGAGWGLRSYQEAAEELGQKIWKNLEVIEAMYQLERDYASDRWFQELQKALHEAYQAY
jgi:hypothetical protein